MADFNKPTVDSHYTQFPNEIRAAISAALSFLDGGSHINIPMKAKRWNPINKIFEEYSGTQWVPMANEYKLPVDYNVLLNKPVPSSSTDSDSETAFASSKAVKVVKALVTAVRNALNNYIPNSKKSNADNSTSSDTIATSYALKKVRDIATTRATDTVAGQTVLSHKTNGTDKSKSASEFALGELHKKLSGKADIKHNHIASDITDFNQATQSVVHNLFNQHHGETGWQVFPSGLIVQWGYANCNYDTIQTISFNITFVNKCIGIVFGQTGQNGNHLQIGNYAGRVGEISYGDVTKANFKLANDGASCRVFWFAVGN